MFWWLSPFHNNFICFTNTSKQTCEVFSAEPLTTNKYKVKDSFNFATEIVENVSSNFMGSLGTDSFFTNIPLEETIKICTSNLFNNDIFDGLKKKWI